MNDYQILESKLSNFKEFIKEISENHETISEYENLGIGKLSLFTAFYLAPKRDDLDSVIDSMREKLIFDKIHDDKVKLYLNLFIDYICGVQDDKNDKNDKNDNDKNDNIECSKDENNIIE
jgi:hypothetical protein